MLAGHNQSIKTLGASVLDISGVTFAGIASTRTNNKALQEDGYMEMADLQFDMTATAFATSGIVDRSQVTIDGEDYKVMNIHKAQHSPIVHLLLAIDR
jgi:hypothetical protein